MRSKQYTLWLEPYLESGEVFLHESGRLGDIISDMHGNPSLFLFIGRGSKFQALRWLATPTRSKRKKRCCGEIHLRFDARARSTQESRPILIADGPIPDMAESSSSSSRDTKNPSRSKTCSRDIKWVGHSINTALWNIYANLFSAFTDVVCLLSSDFRGESGIVDFICTWLNTAASRSSPTMCLPRLLIVVEDWTITRPDQFWEDRWKRRFLQLLRKKTSRPLSHAFSHLSIYHFKKDRTSEEFRYLGLRDRLLNESDTITASRIQKKIYFTGKHFGALFNYDYHHFVLNAGIPFNFIKASRLKNPVPKGLGWHLFHLVKKHNKVEQINYFVLPIVASCILMDSYPPGMHDFDPIEIYQTLYQFSWEKALEILPRETRSKICPLQSIISQLYTAKIYFKLEDYRQLHQLVIFSLQDIWRGVYSDTTCLMCLCRRPEYKLPCGHSFCGIDVQRFGDIMTNNPHVYTVDACFLCYNDTGGARFREKPSTKGVLVLSVDGGGVRVVSPFQILSNLQQNLEPYLLDFHIQDLFDIGVGTSSGGIAIMDMILNGSSVSKSMKQFERSSISSFKRRFGRMNWGLCWLLELLISCVEGLYPASNLEGELIKQFGAETTLMDRSAATEKGTKFAVTATGAHNTPFLFSNYNGVGSRPPKLGYKHAYSDDPGNAIHNWEAARCTSAAPWYFKPHHISGVGTFRDGALWENNPVDIAISEARALWSTKIDLVLSLGTGYRVFNAAETDRMSPAQLEELRDLSISSGNMRDAMIASVALDARRRQGPRHRDQLKVPKEFIRYHTDSGKVGHQVHEIEKGRFFRLDVQLQGELPDLDDQEARRQYVGSKALDDLTESLICTLFYFELTSRPIRNRGHISCQGQLLCIIGPEQHEGRTLRRLLDRLTAKRSKFFVSHHALSGDVNDSANIDPSTKRFRIHVELIVPDSDALIPITLQIGNTTCSTNEGQNISASPFTLEALLEAQGWANPFGRANHGPIDPENIIRRPKTTGKRQFMMPHFNRSKRQRFY
ncbi:hypothetical protein F5884DRAFT_870284 [Xylogone sp. PMI_703]|nr:hypothetical protein F5884DRAFT_870284 [Xylogone sp. PMI_703]